MPRTTSEQVTERVLALAAYMRHERTFTLDRATLDVPGYPDADRVSGGEKLDTNTPAYEALRSTFRRDLEALKTTFGIEAPYHPLRAEYELQSPFFSPAERLALVAAAAAVEVTLDGEGEEDPERWRASVDDEAEVFLEVTDTIRKVIDASRRRQVVEFTYKDRDRRLEPWAVGAWRRHWYVVGGDLDVGAQRTYRIERITDLRMVADTFEVPSDFDRDSALDMNPNRWGTDPQLRVTLEADLAFAPRLADAVGGAITGERSGRAVVEVDSTNRDALFDRVLELGTHARISSPQSVVDELRARLRAMAADR